MPSNASTWPSQGSTILMRLKCDQPLARKDNGALDSASEQVALIPEGKPADRNKVTDNNVTPRR